MLVNVGSNHGKYTRYNHGSFNGPPVIVGNSQGQCSTIRPSFGIQGKGGVDRPGPFRWQDGKQLLSIEKLKLKVE